MTQQRSSFREGCLINQVALVTGGGSGIGKSIALQFLEAGCHVAILSRNMNRLQQSAKELMANVPGRRCFPVAADVRDYDAMSKAVDSVMHEFGRIDILVNGAAGNFLCPIAELSLKGFKTVIDIDTGGTFVASKLVHEKAFTKQAPLYKNHKGTIINISMTLHYVGALFQAHAGAAKAAIDALTSHMAVEWGPQGVRVLGVAPGVIQDTEGFERLLPAGATAGLPPISEFVPLQRLGTAKDVGDVCVFLALPESFYITGHTIVVDGGQWLTAGNYSVLLPGFRDKWLGRSRL